MFYYCKLCGECMLLICHEWSFCDADTRSHFKCHLCSEYFLVYSTAKNKVITEKLRLKNFGLQFFPQTKEARLYKECGVKFDTSHIFFQTLKINELTHELAIQWVNKLKTYIIFQ